MALNIALPHGKVQKNTEKPLLPLVAKKLGAAGGPLIPSAFADHPVTQGKPVSLVQLAFYFDEKNLPV